MDRLGINDRNELFWDGQRVEVRRRLVLTRVQQAVALAVSAAAVAGGLGAAASGAKDGAEFLCARGRGWACP
jgi:homospermidine synthase